VRFPARASRCCKPATMRPCRHRAFRRGDQRVPRCIRCLMRYSVASVPRIAVACENSTPPLPWASIGGDGNRPVRTDKPASFQWSGFGDWTGPGEFGHNRCAQYAPVQNQARTRGRNSIIWARGCPQIAASRNACTTSFWVRFGLSFQNMNPNLTSSRSTPSTKRYSRN
jgi:hypothetical protein